MIELGKKAPLDRGVETTFSLNDVLATSMYRRHKKRRSEAQRRHDILLHRSRDDPAGYRAATLESITDTVKEQRQRARIAEADAEGCKKALDSAQNQVHPSASVSENM